MEVLKSWQTCPKCGGKKSFYGRTCRGCNPQTGLKHGHNTRKGKSGAYSSWDHMIQRCTNPANEHYRRYGGRGIKVCSRWSKFENFLADMGERPEGLTIERIKNNKGYSPKNCRWATRRQQSNNTGRNRYVTDSGLTLTVAEWCRVLNVKYSTLHQRYERGQWPL